MQIIITNTFKNDFLSIFKFQQLFDKFLVVIKNKAHKLIDLKYPYKKFKCDIWNITVRWIVFISNENIIPIYIVKKSNKQYWENLILNKEIMLLLEIKLKFSKLDLINWDFFKI